MEIIEGLRREKVWMDIGKRSRELYPDTFTPSREGADRFFDVHGRPTFELQTIRQRLKQTIPQFFQSQDIRGVFGVGGYINDLVRPESDFDVLVRTNDLRWEKGPRAPAEYLTLLRLMNPQEDENSLRRYLVEGESTDVLRNGKSNFIDMLVDNRELGSGYDLVNQRWVRMQDNFIQNT